MKNQTYLIALGLIVLLSPMVVAQPPVEWVGRYAYEAQYDDIAYAIAVDDSGNVYVTGASYGYEEFPTIYETGEGYGYPSTDGGEGEPWDYATIKYDANGNELWVARYDGLGEPWGESDADDRATALAIDDLGNVYVTGYSDQGSSTDYNYATIKYDANGNELWVALYDGTGNGDDEAFALAVDDLGNVYVTGQSRGSGTNSDYTTIKYDPNGDELWVARYDSNTSGWDGARALVIDDSGNVYVTGESSGSTYSDYATVKYDADGNELWVARYDGPAGSADSAHALAIDDSGNVYVTGRSNGSGSSYDYATIKYGPNGVEIWTARYNGTGNSSDIASALAVDDAGSVYVTGESAGSGTGYDYATVKYDSNGGQLWVSRYNGPANQADRAHDLAIDDSGNVYITGESNGNGTDIDYATIRYGTDGSEQWVARYSRIIDEWDSWDRATALALDNLGNVYVTGGSYGSDEWDYMSVDYITVKYRQQGYCLRLDGDITGDCKVNFEDFALMASHWLECNSAIQEECQ